MSITPNPCFNVVPTWRPSVFATGYSFGVTSRWWDFKWLNIHCAARLTMVQSSVPRQHAHAQRSMALRFASQLGSRHHNLEAGNKKLYKFPGFTLRSTSNSQTYSVLFGLPSASRMAQPPGPFSPLNRQVKDNVRLWMHAVMDGKDPRASSILKYNIRKIYTGLEMQWRTRQL